MKVESGTMGAAQGVRCVGNTDVPVAVPKIFALPYGGRLKF